MPCVASIARAVTTEGVDALGVAMFYSCTGNPHGPNSAKLCVTNNDFADGVIVKWAQG